MKTHGPLREALALKERAGSSGQASSRALASGAGWRVSDVLCTSGPRDRAFEERHGGVAIAAVLAGTFSYRGSHGRALMTPGSLLLGNSETCFSCGHEHGEGDRCLSFYFDAAVFERIAADVGARRAEFSRNRIAANRATAPAITHALQLLHGQADAAEVAYSLAALALRMNQSVRVAATSLRDERRVIDVVRWLEQSIAEPHTLDALAGRAHLSPYHFLRVFKSVVGASPHQFILRARLRLAAQQLVATAEPVTAIAYSVGFSDLAHFTRSFSAEFGMSPMRYRSGARI